MINAQNEKCPRCKGAGWYWRTPQGFNPFLAGGFQTAKAMFKATCDCVQPARSAPSFDPLLGSGGLPLEQGNEQ